MDKKSESGLENFVKKEVSRVRSEVRKAVNDFKATKKEINPFTGLVSGNYWTQTGMPWIQSEGRKAVLTDWFWQPIRGQPRRVDTNEIRQFAGTYWINSCVMTFIQEISSLEWDIVPDKQVSYDQVSSEIDRIKEFFDTPNKNGEPFNFILRALCRDILELDAGVWVKVFTRESYDFEHLEPKSGAPLLKEKGQRQLVEVYARDGASFLKETDKFGFVRGYWQYSYQIPAHPMWFNREEIMYISEQPRSQSPYGWSRVQSIMDIVKSLHYSTLYNKRFFEETTIPDGALSLEDTNETEMNEFRNYLNREFKAQPHKLAVINKKINFFPFSTTNQELQFLETQKWYYLMVISMFGLTPTEMGLTEDSNRATSATQAELVKRKGIRPFLRLLESYVNREIVEELTDAPISFQFIYDDPAEKAAKLANWESEMRMGIITPNEIRMELGKEPIEGGDAINAGNTYSEGDGESGSESEKNEDRQSPGYHSQRRRAEGESEKNKLVQDPFSMANRPVGSFKSFPVVGATKPEPYGIGAPTQVDAGMSKDRDLGKPFAGFENFDACVISMKDKGYSDEVAHKICGKLQSDE